MSLYLDNTSFVPYPNLLGAVSITSWLRILCPVLLVPQLHDISTRNNVPLSDHNAPAGCTSEVFVISFQLFPNDQLLCKKLVKHSAPRSHQLYRVFHSLRSITTKFFPERDLSLQLSGERIHSIILFLLSVDQLS